MSTSTERRLGILAGCSAHKVKTATGSSSQMDSITRRKLQDQAASFRQRSLPSHIIEICSFYDMLAVPTFSSREPHSVLMRSRYGTGYKEMRETYFEMPMSTLATCGSVLLDWNISAFIEGIHKRQLRGDAIDGSGPQIARLRNLANAMPKDCGLITGLSAAESEIRPDSRAVDTTRYNTRADIASFYLSNGKSYLHALLDGHPTSGLVIEPTQTDGQSQSFEILRQWMTVSYAALLQAVVIDQQPNNTMEEKINDYRFWLEHILGIAASREAWVGFLLLAGKGPNRQKARRLLKLDSPGDAAAQIWGATWDLMYTRMPALLRQSQFLSEVKQPVTFVTDDSGLVDVLSSIQSVVSIKNMRGVEFTGDETQLDALDDSVEVLVGEYMLRESQRVLTKSQGITNSVMKRARHQARLAKEQLRDTPIT